MPLSFVGKEWNDFFPGGRGTSKEAACVGDESVIHVGAIKFLQEWRAFFAGFETARIRKVHHAS
jgi:hypothetical protein